MTYTYIPRGVCSRKMEIDIEEGVIRDVRIAAGCNGNLQGIVRLVRGISAAEAADRLRGIRCGGKQTSCPDQLAIALTEALEAENGAADQNRKGEQTDDR